MSTKYDSPDKVSNELAKIACDSSMDICWDRLDEQSPQCGFGQLGICCRICAMGPCQIDPFGKGAKYGVCGADADTIAARHFVRMIAGGTAAHSDHGRAVCETMIAIAKGEADGYEIKDEQKLLQVAMDLQIEIGDRSINDIALEIGEKALSQFGQQNGKLLYTKKAPLARQKIWDELGVTPRGIDREVVEIMHRTHIGVDQHYKNLMFQGTRAALADGWGGSMMATEIQDIIFGAPVPLRSQVNLGILKEDEVNILIHGHEPLLSEILVAVAQEKEMLDYAKEKGAKGINLGGICCTANEILMRHGVPLAGNFLQQELALATNAVDAMVVDVQCVMQSLGRLSQNYHTEIISTSDRAQMPFATHIEFHEDHALEGARKILKAAIDAFANREGKTHIPKGEDATTELIAGFTEETIGYLLGGVFRASYKPLNDNIRNGKIRGIAGVVGCNNPKEALDGAHVAMVKELIKNDVIVLQTGCSAMACAKAGLLLPEAAAKYAGAGLAEVCETVGIPPVLHLGSCVDNSRILLAATAVVKEGGLGDDISELPAAGAAPEWMSEKAISIGQYFVASGVYTVFGTAWPTLGAPNLTKYLFEEIEEEYGGKWAFEMDPVKAAHMMIDHINKKREALGLKEGAQERVLMDMESRRQLEG